MYQHHDRLQQMLNVYAKMKEINDVRQEKAQVNVNKEDHTDGPQIIGEAMAAMNDVQELEANCADKISLEKHIEMLDTDQIFKHVSDHLLHRQKHETGVSKCSQLQPLHMFISGVGGTGKSFLIEAIRTQVAAIWKDKHDALLCAVAAPTGLAAFNVSVVTVQRLFQLPTEHEGKEAGYWRLPQDSLKIMRTTLQDVKLFIIDEVSMLFSLNLVYFHLHLEEVFGTDNRLGSISILFVGDLLQLPPGCMCSGDDGQFLDSVNPQDNLVLHVSLYAGSRSKCGTQMSLSICSYVHPRALKKFSCGGKMFCFDDEPRLS